MPIPALALALVISAVGPAPAATVTWDGGGGADTTWHNTLNWDGDALPGTADSALISSNLTATFTADSGSQTVSSLAVGAASGPGTLAVSGGTLSVTNNLEVHSGGLVQLGTTVTAGALGTVSNALPGGTIENTVGTDATLVAGSAGLNTTYAGVLQDNAGGGALALRMTGTGTLTLSGTNTFSGGITLLNAGGNTGSTLALDSADAAGAGDITFNHFNRLVNGPAGPSAISNDISTAGWFFWQPGSRALEVQGSWTNRSDVFWLNSTNVITFSGPVRGTASTGFYGGGKIALTNPTNDFTGNFNSTLNCTIQFATIDDSGVNSSLGAGTAIIFDLSDVQSFNGGFENIGAGGSTDRDVILGQHNGTPWARIDNNGTGALDFNGTFTNLSNAGATRNLRLGGDYAGENTISSVLSDGGNGGQLAITKEGSTTWILSGNNSYSGPTAVNGGRLILSGTNTISGGITVRNNNSTLHLESPDAVGTGDLTFGGGTFVKFFNGASGPSSIRNNLVTTPGTWFYWESGSKALEIEGTWNNSSGVVWLNSTNTLTVSGVVSGTWSTGFYSSGGYHTIALTNPTNDFTGNYNATLNSTIQFNTIANKGVNSSLGAGTQIIFDLSDVQSFNGGFENIGAGGSTDRDVILGQHNGTPWARIDNNGTGALDFNGTFTNLSNAGATRNLRLGGDYAGENTISSVLSDGGNGGQLAITKDGTTTWILTGDNTHTGPTAVNGGALLANNTTGSATGAGVVNVNSGGTLGGTGTVSGATTVAASGAVAPATAALTFTDGLTLMPDSLLNMRLVTAGNHARVVISGGSAAYTTSGPVSVNVLGAPAEGEYTLVDGTGIGTWETDLAHYSLEVPVGYTGELRIVDQTLVLTLALPKAAFITIR